MSDINNSDFEYRLSEISSQIANFRNELQLFRSTLNSLEQGALWRIKYLNVQHVTLHAKNLLLLRNVSAKREIEMQQKIELEEETCSELKQVFASLQQQVDFKRDKLKRLNNKLQSIRQENKDNHELYLKDRQEIENANDEAAMNLRQSFLIIDNFVPAEERSRIISLAQFDEDSDNWTIKKDVTKIYPSERPIAHKYRRPISDYAVHQALNESKYRGENILDLKLDMPLRTTQEYVPPSICPQIKALVSDVIKREMENSHVVIRIPPHTVLGRNNTSKLEQEGKYKQALRSLVDVHNLNKAPVMAKPLPPRSAKSSSYQLKQS